MARNQLNHQKLYQLAEYLKKSLPDITRQELSCDKLAVVAGKALGFELTERNIVATAKIAGVKLPYKARSSTGAGGQATFNKAFSDRLTRQENAITALVEQVARLDAEVKHLKLGLGVV